MFLRHLWDRSDAETQDYNGFAADRGVSFMSLERWGVARSTTTGDWVVPAHGLDGQLKQLYRYVEGHGRRVLMPTPTLGHYLFGMNLYDKSKKTLYLAEGPWDGIALWEALATTRWGENELVETGSQTTNLLMDANVLAVPGCGAVGDPLARNLPELAGVKVVLLFDNDHDRWQCTRCAKTYSIALGACPKCGSFEHRSKVPTPSPGALASARAAKILRTAKSPPESISYLQWSSGSRFDPALPDGCDVRDLLTGVGIA